MTRGLGDPAGIREIESSARSAPGPFSTIRTSVVSAFGLTIHSEITECSECSTRSFVSSRRTFSPLITRGCDSQTETRLVSVVERAIHHCLQPLSAERLYFLSAGVSLNVSEAIVLGLTSGYITTG